MIIADVYAAGEQKIDGVDRDALVAAIKAHGHRRAIGLPSPEELPAWSARSSPPGDYVVCLGAGNITQWAYALPEQLAGARDEPRALAVPQRWQTAPDAAR